jgi:hypothetical protein
MQDIYRGTSISPLDSNMTSSFGQKRPYGFQACFRGSATTARSSAIPVLYGQFVFAILGILQQVIRPASIVILFRTVPSTVDSLVHVLSV